MNAKLYGMIAIIISAIIITIGVIIISLPKEAPVMVPTKLINMHTEDLNHLAERLKAVMARIAALEKKQKVKRITNPASDLAKVTAAIKNIRWLISQQDRRSDAILKAIKNMHPGLYDPRVNQK